MFGRVHLLLAAFCVTALFCEGLADCISANWGFKTDSMYEIPPAVVEKDETDVYVNLPFTSAMSCVVVGVTATMCNPDAGGSLKFVSQFTVHVLRPTAEDEGIVYSAVYCDKLFLRRKMDSFD